MDELNGTSIRSSTGLNELEDQTWGTLVASNEAKIKTFTPLRNSKRNTIMVSRFTLPVF